MKLYFSPGACSLAPHIVLREAGLPFEPVLASTKTHQLTDGTDYYTINPKGYVPLLELDDGQRLSEGPVINQYLADLAPDSKLAPPAGTMERYRLQEWLNFITAEVHKGYGVLFNPVPEEGKAVYRGKLRGRYEWIESQLAGKTWLMGDTFSIADAYLFTCTRWAPFSKVDTSGLPNLAAYMERCAARPAVREALQAEGLLQAA